MCVCVCVYMCMCVLFISYTSDFGSLQSSYRSLDRSVIRKLSLVMTALIGLPLCIMINDLAKSSQFNE